MTIFQPNAGTNLSMGAAGRLVREADRLGRLGLSPRQQDLNRLWSYYMCQQYADRKIDWDGSEFLEPLEKVAISSGKQMPPGFYDAGGQTLPIKFRRPSAPYHLTKVIVDRFTSLLFSEKRHPRLTIEADPISEDFIDAVAEEGRLWPTMMQARAFGGATGSACVGFQFLNGRPFFEVHDPRWVFPYFKDRSTLELSAIEKKYVFYQDIYNEDEERYESVPFWFRRVIDDTVDIIYKPAYVGDGTEPNWEIAKEVEHNFGFCPVVWIQNIPIVGDVDGLTDVHGTYDMMESMDILNAQAQRANTANCDPTVVISSDAEMDSVKTGSGNAIKIPNGTVTLLEHTGAGPTAAREQAQDYRRMILEVSQCFLEGEQSGGAMTATEVERRYSSMLAKADILREQYGERGVKPLLRMVMQAAKILNKGKQLPDGTYERYKLDLPPKVVFRGEGVAPKLEERKLGPGPYRVGLNWPRYFEPSAQDIQQAVTSASAAKQGGLIDDKHASQHIAEFFKIEDLPKLLEDLKKAREAVDSAMMSGFGGGGV